VLVRVAPLQQLRTFFIACLSPSLANFIIYGNFYFQTKQKARKLGKLFFVGALKLRLSFK
jgi:hypothetical protein